MKEPVPMFLHENYIPAACRKIKDAGLKIRHAKFVKDGQVEVYLYGKHIPTEFILELYDENEKYKDFV